MSLPKTYSTGGRGRGLPVDGTIDYSAVADPDPRDTYPPVPIWTRMDRLAWLWELFNGDFDDLVPYEEVDRDNQTNPTRALADRATRTKYTVQVNPFRVVATTAAEFLLMEPPEFSDPRQAVNVHQSLYDIIAHQVIYGASVVMATGEPTDPLDVLEPAWWVPTTSGWWHGIPLVDNSGNYTEIYIQQYYKDLNEVTHGKYVFGGTYYSNVGDLIEEYESTEAPEDPVRVIPRLPRRRGFEYRWGTSMFEDIASVAAETNKIYSDISYALGQQATPNATARIADGDRDTISPGVGDTTPFDDSIDELGAELNKYSRHRLWAIPNSIQALDPFTWDPRIGESLIMIQNMNEAIETACSMPGMFSGFMMEGMNADLSGRALKRIMTRFYASTRHTQAITEVSVNELFELSGLPPMDWPNALEVMEEGASMEGDDEGVVSDEPATS